MGRGSYRDKDLADLDELIGEITVDAYGDDEQLWAFRQAFEDDVTFPADGFVIGEPVSVVEIDYDGNVRRGLTAKCRREDGSEHAVAVSQVVLPGNERRAPDRCLHQVARPRSPRRGRARLRPPALAQSVGQPGSAIPDRGRQGEEGMGRVPR